MVSARVTIFAVRAPQMVAATTEARVAPIELFFDLVFVFGLTQITTLMAYDVSAHGIARGLLVWGLPMVVALCYFAFRGLHLVLFWVLSRTDHGLRRQLIRWILSVIGGTALLLVASRYTGALQTGLWALALLADYGGTLLAGAAGWRRAHRRISPSGMG